MKIKESITKSEKVAIMQPYFFPYIGYFQIVKAVDTFVFYDDVNFINRGWINRNKILSNSKELLFTLPLKRASQNKLIKEIETDISEKWKSKFSKTLHFNYCKAPHFREISELIESCFDNKNQQVASLAMNSVIKVSNYLNIKTDFEVSSEKYHDTKGMDRALRLIEICKRNGARDYLNPIGGQELYDKTFFNNQNIRLIFIEPQEIVYKQFQNQFVPGLSIIDVMMFNSPEEIRRMLNQYDLV